jgi:hypothetical protein
MDSHGRLIDSEFLESDGVGEMAQSAHRQLVLTLVGVGQPRCPYLALFCEGLWIQEVANEYVAKRR